MTAKLSKALLILCLAYVALLMMAPLGIGLTNGTLNNLDSTTALLVFMSPILALSGGLAIFTKLMSRPEPKSVKKTAKEHKLQWTLSRLVIISSVVGLSLTSAALNFVDNLHNYYLNSVLSNWGLAAIVLSAVLGLILIGLQRGTYGFWVLARQADKLDERQIRVRQRVFERAYSMLILGVFLICWQYDQSNYYIANRSVYVFLILAFAMPSIVAAGQKDA